MSDPNMDTTLKWADEFRLPSELPVSLLSVDQRAKLVNVINNDLVRGDLLHTLTDDEKARRLIANASKEFLPNAIDDSAWLNL